MTSNLMFCGVLVVCCFLSLPYAMKEIGDKNGRRNSYESNYERSPLTHVIQFVHSCHLLLVYEL